MDDKMREDFEVWAINQARSMSYSFPGEAVQINGLGDYAIVWVHGAWLGWQASRAALCVELPEMSDYIDRHGQGENCDSYLRDLRDAIHAAGVLTK